MSVPTPHLPNWSPPSLPNISAPNLPNVNLPPPPNFIINPGPQSTSGFDDPIPPSRPSKPNPKSTLPNYPGDVGKPLGTSAPGTITIDGQHQHTNPAGTPTQGIQFDPYHDDQQAADPGCRPRR